MCALVTGGLDEYSMVIKMFGVLGLVSGLVAVATFQLWWTLSRPQLQVEVGTDFYSPAQASGVVTNVSYPAIESWLYLLLFSAPLVLGLAVGIALTRAGWSLSRAR